MDSNALRRKFNIPQFRALIIGRPNAGKTTILRSIAKAADGRVDPSPGRGTHDIKEELVFESNKGFVFHDSCGIESGSTSEMESIQAFISERAKATSLRKKLHAIWYCIPTDNARLLLAAEEQFFDKIDPNGVPVILIFTKFESQEANAYKRIMKEHPTMTPKEARPHAQAEARQHFDQVQLLRFQNRNYPPKGFVYLKNMHKSDADSTNIIKMTTNALTDNALQWLLTTVQEVNIGIRIKKMLGSLDLNKLNKLEK